MKCAICDEPAVGAYQNYPPKSDPSKTVNLPLCEVHNRKLCFTSVFPKWKPVDLQPVEVEVKSDDVVVMAEGFEVVPIPRAVITFPTDCDVSQEEADRLAFGVKKWLEGEGTSLVLCPGATMEVYGIPKAGGCGVSLTKKYGDIEETYSAPTIDELFEMMRRYEAESVAADAR